MTLRVGVGADHGGFHMKVELLHWLKERGYDVMDVGAYEIDPSDDYPDFADAVALVVANGQTDRGVLICGSGVGASITANKVTGVRASLCHDTYSAHQGVEHDDMNVLCLGERVIGIQLAKELVATFLDARFSGEERHQRRLNKLLAIERRTNTPTDGGST